jgi:competence protein ComEA
VDGSTELLDLLSLAGARPGLPATLLTITITPADSGASPQRVDINRAEAWLLEALPGVGPDRAQAIVDFRTEHGCFARIEELMLVPGIGSGIYESLRDFVTVSE